MSFDRDQAELVVRRVEATIGLAFGGSRRPQLLAAVGAAAADAGAGNAVDYVHLLDQDRSVFDDLVDRLTVGETYFFRDARHFELLRDVVLPEVLGRTDRPVRMWSAGCGTGEEPYSLAIFLDQLGLGSRAEIVATDLNRRSLAAAREGRYRPWSLRAMDDEDKARWFGREGDDFVLDEDIRRRVAFAPLNLASEAADRTAGPREVDVVFCRNVLIYLTEEAVKRAVSLIAESMAPGGWLVTASVDPILDGDIRLRVVRTKAGNVYRRVDATEEQPGRQKRGLRRGAPRSLELRRRVETRPRPVAEPRARPIDVRTPLPDHVRVLADSGRVREALEAVETGIQSDPLDAHLHALHAAVLIELGRRRDAVTAARAAVYLDPRNAEAHALLAVAQGAGAAARRSTRNAVRASVAEQAGDEQ